MNKYINLYNFYIYINIYEENRGCRRMKRSSSRSSRRNSSRMSRRGGEQSGSRITIPLIRCHKRGVTWAQESHSAYNACIKRYANVLSS